MKENKIAPLEKAKEFWGRQTAPKRKKIILGAAIAVLLIVVSIVVTTALNSTRSGYKVLYPGLDASETPEVYSALQELGVQPEVNASGEIMVPGNQYDNLLLQLAAKGYPKTAMPYNIFFDHNSLTSTEFEKKQLLIYQLQDRLQDTLKRIDGVTDAAVTITLAEQSQYVWQQATQDSDSSASVLLTLKKGMELAEEEVLSIKNLVAASTPRLTAEHVKIVDSGTRLELGADVGGTASSMVSSQTLKYEQQVQKQIEDNVVRILSPRYGSGGVVATAKVTLDFDAMIQESNEIQKQPDGEEAVTSESGQYGVNGNVPYEGIAGEQDNTDVPGYAANDPTGENGMTDYKYNKEYDYSRIKTQIEKGAAVIKRATISVMVNDTLTDAKRTELLDLVSKSTDIPVANISLASVNLPAVDTPEPEPEPGDTGLTDMQKLLGLAGIVLFFVLTTIIVIIILRKRAKKAAMAAVAVKEEEIESQTQNLQAEINEYKRKLEEAARASSNPKDDAIVDGVRDFAKENPEITANLLRSWLKEDD